MKNVPDVHKLDRNYHLRHPIVDLILIEGFPYSLLILNLIV